MQNAKHRCTGQQKKPRSNLGHIDISSSTEITLKYLGLLVAQLRKTGSVGAVADTEVRPDIVKRMPAVFHYEWPPRRKKEELALSEKKEEGAGAK